MGDKCCLSSSLQRPLRINQVEGKLVSYWTLWEILFTQKSSCEVLRLIHPPSVAKRNFTHWNTTHSIGLDVSKSKV